VAALVVLVVTQRDTTRNEPGEGQSLATALVDLQTVAELSSAEASLVQRWLETRVGYPVEVPNISGAVLDGGRVVSANGSKLAAVNFRLHGKPLTYIAMPTAEVMGSHIKNEFVETTSLNGYNVATWIERGTARAVIAPMPRRDVAAIARECKRKAAAI
jgi:anti-sigma factor RsiW